MPKIFAILSTESGRKELRHLARPRKCRRVCDYPRTLAFSPEESGACQPPVILTVDEYETIDHVSFLNMKAKKEAPE